MENGHAMGASALCSRLRLFLVVGVFSDINTLSNKPTSGCAIASLCSGCIRSNGFCHDGFRMQNGGNRGDDPKSGFVHQPHVQVGVLGDFRSVLIRTVISLADRKAPLSFP